MGTREINTLLEQTANAIREYTADQVEVWQAIPYWTLESDGRGGWSDNRDIPYRYGLIGVGSQWPYQVFVELWSGRLVQIRDNEIQVAPDQRIITNYIESASRFDALAQVIAMMDQATNGEDTYNKEGNDARRAELKAKYNVPRRWTTPATPIIYRYGG